MGIIRIANEKMPKLPLVGTASRRPARKPLFCVRRRMPRCAAAIFRLWGFPASSIPSTSIVRALPIFGGFPGFFAFRAKKPSQGS
ncbi:MAG: hypothetical protein V1728_06575 [Candidatus Micrarchaeota archaeon]